MGPDGLRGPERERMDRLLTDDMIGLISEESNATDEMDFTKEILKRQDARTAAIVAEQTRREVGEWIAKHENPHVRIVGGDNTYALPKSAVADLLSGKMPL